MIKNFTNKLNQMNKKETEPSDRNSTPIEQMGLDPDIGDALEERIAALELDVKEMKDKKVETEKYDLD